MNLLEEIRVLIVDDDSLVCEMTQGIVEDIGHTVVGRAANGQQAVKLVQELQPDVVLMDIDMPDMNGIEASRQIQRHCPTPVVVLTAYDTPDLIHQASQAGVGAYLVKPPDPSEMERAILIARARFEDLRQLQLMNQTLQNQNQSLQDLNVELQARNEELDAFSRTVAHDLKNPLHLIVGYSNVLADELNGNEDLWGVVTAITETGKKMNKIIEELLLLARIAKTEVNIEPLNMAGLVDECQTRLRLLIKESQAEISQPAEWPEALGYPPWIEEVWVNYMSNALKYGGTPPRLALGAQIISPDGGADNEAPGQAMIRFWIQDNGPGITPEDQAILFTDFTQLDKKRAKGHGLGLAIVQRIVQKLGGQVSVESQEGEGSRFSFTLPKA